MPNNNGRVFNCLRSTKTEDDWSLESAVSAGVIRSTAAVRRAKDLRRSWWRIGDQGETGACVAWATADGLLRYHFVKARKLQQNERLSIRYVWMSGKETDNIVSYPTTFIDTAGTRIKAVLDIARRYGVVREKVLRSNSGALYQKKAAAFYKEAGRLKITSYFHLKGGPKEWRRWICQQGPIAVGFIVDEAWKNATRTTARLYKYGAPSSESGHAALLVGYTETYFIVRNSWGSAWGDRGYAFVYDAYARAAFFEAYGISI